MDRFNPLWILLFVVGIAALALANPTYVPTYSARYSDDTTLREMLSELKGIRAELKALRQQGQTQSPLPKDLKSFVTLHCAKCHNETKAEGDFTLLMKDGKVAPLSVAEKKRIMRMVTKGDMPKDHPLSEAERLLLNDLLFPKEE